MFSRYSYFPRDYVSHNDKKTALPIVNTVLEGFNCTIFAYGQTGTGKTYTMEGDRDTEDTTTMSIREKVSSKRNSGTMFFVVLFCINPFVGIISRSINRIFEYLKQTSDEYSVKVSHMELYNEELIDLLDETVELKIFEGSSQCFTWFAWCLTADYSNPHQKVTVKNLTEINVYEPSDIFNVLEKSWNVRKVAQTQMNSLSRFFQLFTDHDFSNFQSISLHFLYYDPPQGEKCWRWRFAEGFSSHFLHFVLST